MRPLSSSTELPVETPEIRKRILIETLDRFGNLLSGEGKPLRKKFIDHIKLAGLLEVRKGDNSQQGVQTEPPNKRESLQFPFRLKDKTKAHREYME